MDIGCEWNAGVRIHFGRSERYCLFRCLRITPAWATKERFEGDFICGGPRIVSRSMDDIEQWRNIHSAPVELVSISDFIISFLPMERERARRNAE